MPPKKSATNGDAGEAGGLLLLTQGRYVKPDEYDQLSKAFAGTTVGSIRNRISQLRVKQRDLYEQLNWELPEGGAGHSAKKTTKKRGIDDVNGAAGQKTPTKSPRKRMRKTKSEEVVDKSSEGEGEEEMEQDMGMGMVIKEEVEDEL